MVVHWVTQFRCEDCLARVTLVDEEPQWAERASREDLDQARAWVRDNPKVSLFALPTLPRHVRMKLSGYTFVLDEGRYIHCPSCRGRAYPQDEASPRGR